MKKIKWLLILLILLLIPLSYYIYKKYCNYNKTGKQDYSITKLTKDNITKVIETTGEIVPKLEVEIKCKASGEITKLPVDISDSVKKGDLLLQLDPEDEETSVKKAEVSLASSEAELKQAIIKQEDSKISLKAESLRALRTLSNARKKVTDYTARLARASKLKLSGALSTENYESVHFNYITALNDFESAKAKVVNIKNLEFDVQLKEHDVEIAKAKEELDRLELKLAKQRLIDTTVIAPINGIISEKKVQIGQIITSSINDSDGTSIMKIIDISNMYVLAYVDESSIGQVKLGQYTEISVDAYPNLKFTGKVTRIAATGTVSSNVVRYEVKIEINKENRNLLKPMMTANVEIFTLVKNDVYCLPVNAIHREGKKNYVNILTNNKSKVKRFVETGVRNNEKVQVIKGITNKDNIIINDGIDNTGQWNKNTNRRKMGGGPMGLMP